MYQRKTTISPHQNLLKFIQDIKKKTCIKIHVFIYSKLPHFVDWYINKNTKVKMHVHLSRSKSDLHAFFKCIKLEIRNSYILWVALHVYEGKMTFKTKKKKKKIQNDQNNTSINSHIRGVKWCQVSKIYRDRNFGSSLIQSGASN